MGASGSPPLGGRPSQPSGRHPDPGAGRGRGPEFEAKGAVRGDAHVPSQGDRRRERRGGGIQPHLIDAALDAGARAARGAEVLAGVDPAGGGEQGPAPGLLGRGVKIADEGRGRLPPLGKPLERRVDQGPRAFRGAGVPVHLGDPERQTCPQAEDEALQPPRRVVCQGSDLPRARGVA